MKVIWSDDAKLELDAIETELGMRYSPETAERIVDGLLNRIDLLEDHPEMGRMVPEYGYPQLREIVDRWNRVLYRLRSDAIEILAIVPARVPLPILESDDDE